MIETRQEYVLGFMFDVTRETVALIKKNRPVWQAGKFNGIGGHIEDTDESIHTAQVREFLEETGVQTAVEDWCNFLTIENEKCIVHVFRAFSDKVASVKTTTDESVELDPVGWVHGNRFLPNIQWMIALALDDTTQFTKATFS